MRSQSGRGAFTWAMLASALASVPVARAASAGGLALRWSDASGLAPSDSADFEARLAERLGRPAFDAEGAGGRVLSVSWQGTPEQCRIELQLLRDGKIEGTRQLESPNGDCKSLAPALLTVSALLIESSDLEPPTQPEPARTSEPPPPASAAAEQQPPAPPSGRRAPVALLSVGAQLSSGLAPRLELGPAAALVFAPHRHARIGVAAAYYLPHEYGAGPSFELQHASAGLMACAMPLTGSLGAGVCTSGTAHRFAATGLSLPHPAATQTLAWSVGLSARAEWRLARSLWWVGSVGADVNPQPLYFYFQPAAGGETILFEQRRLAPQLFLGLSLELP